jgi:hypothetical protein
LPLLERLARGEQPPTDQFAPHDDEIQSFRQRLGPISPLEIVLWNVLDRWPFADEAGWKALLDEAIANSIEPMNRKEIADLRTKLERFAASEVRSTLAAATEIRRSVEFLADLGAHSLPTIRGCIDFLYRDAPGWHILGIDWGSGTGEDPWRRRQPGLVVQAWAVRQQLGEWPVTIGLIDLETGKVIESDPSKVNFAEVAKQFGEFR